METYDAIIVGAGPAGGECARELTKAGKRTLLAEKANDFSVNNYSSAGAPLEIMSDFSLPEHVIGTSWNKIHMETTHNAHTWVSSERRGVVLDFSKLRGFLADESVKQGGELQLGTSYQSHELQNGNILVTLKDKDRQRTTYKTKVLVDASGAERSVLAKQNYDKTKAVVATGIEFLVKVDPAIYQKYANMLSVYMGLEWMPQGYSWIFPMEANHLKVGVGRYFQNHTYVPHENSYQHYMDHMIQSCLGNDVEVIDRHGKTLYYTYGRHDAHFDGNVIAIGDAVSTVNPLALEGIRHAMTSGRIAAKHILARLNGKTSDFKDYQKEMNRYTSFKWMLCEKMMNTIYRIPEDKKIDMLVSIFKGFTMDEMIDLSFHYKWQLILKFYTQYLYQTAKKAITHP